MMRKKIFILLAVLCALAVAASLMVGCGKKKPEMDSIAPASAAPGAKVTVIGADFGDTQGDSMVDLGNESAKIVTWADTSITLEVPANLKAGDYKVSVQTEAGESNEMDFTVKEEEKKEEEPKAGNTPEEAIAAYEKAKGEDLGNYVLKGSKTSRTDPSWALYDYQRYEGMGHVFYLLHKVDNQWTVVADGADLNPQAHGAPADLTI